MVYELQGENITIDSESLDFGTEDRGHLVVVARRPKPIDLAVSHIEHQAIAAGIR